MFSRLTSVTLAVLATAAVAVNIPRALPTGCDRTYTVQPGDTCNAISAANNVSTYQLAIVNNGTINPYCDNLYPDEVICLGIAGQDCSTTYVMQSGDTCYTIAVGAGTTVATLLANNPNVNADCTNIYPSEVLCTAPYDVYA